MRRLHAVLTLALLLPVPALAGQITVQPGETLSEIADRLGVSVSRLMQLNGITKADHVEAGQVLKVPGSSSSGGRAGAAASASGRVTVREGDTLSEIADRSGMSLQQLMRLNGLSSADHIEVGQVLKVRGASPAATAQAAPTYRRGAGEHVVRPGESLSQIADGYGIAMSKLVAINAIGDPDHVEVGSRLKLKGEPPAPRPKPPVTTTASSPAPARATTVRPEPAVNPRPESEGTPVAAAVASVTAAPVRQEMAAAPTPGSGTPAGTSTGPSTVAVNTPDPGQAAISRALLPSGTEARPAATPATTPVVAMVTPAATPAATVPASRPMGAPISRAATASLSTASASPVRTTAAPASRSPVPAAVSPITTAAATTPAAPQTSTSGWRRYGPLQVDWTNWQPMGGSLVAPILTAKGDSLYLAINCGARKLNATSANGDWRTWDDPQADFERRLVNDLCSARS